jgi:thiamine-phosphate pyrophosphorylase
MLSQGRKERPEPLARERLFRAHRRHKRLQRAVLYLVCDERDDAFLEAALRGGVDIVQLRMKDAPDEDVIAAGRRFKRICEAHEALLIVNDRPDLAVAIDADGVHLGQDDSPPAEARSIVGTKRLIGQSTHTPAQIDTAAAVVVDQTDAAAGADDYANEGAAIAVDYIGVGPVHETPTKPGRAAVGLDLVRYAAAHAALPFFAIGGITRDNVAAARAAGATRIAVVRALTEAADPAAAAHDLRAALERRTEARVGSA